MGRKPWTNRLTVEDCPVRLSIPDLARDRVLEFTYQGSSSYSTILNGVEIARFQFRRYDNISGYSLYFPPQVLRPSEPEVWSAGQWINLSGSRCIGQGRRFWFTCKCGKWAGILYLPPGSAEFLCRNCHNLTYRSCQKRKPPGWVSPRHFLTKPSTLVKVWSPRSVSPVVRSRGIHQPEPDPFQVRPFNKRAIEKLFEELWDNNTASVVRKP
jgi:hypothetical protein